MIGCVIKGHNCAFFSKFYCRKQAQKSSIDNEGNDEDANFPKQNEDEEV